METYVTYVIISDLIANGGEGCTLLSRKPHSDYITIVEDDSSVLGIVKISHKREILLRRLMKWDIREPEKWLTIDDLNDARMALFRDRVCKECQHLFYYHCWRHGSDNWDNFKAGSCPEYIRKSSVKAPL